MRAHGAFETDSLWVRRAARSRPALRLICLPYGGGGASVYHSLAGLLPDTIEVVALQLPGREDRSGEPPPVNLRRLVHTGSIALGPYCALPYAFYGHCAGALLAFELAHEINARFGTWPRHFIAAAQHAPHLPSTSVLLRPLPDDELLDTVRRRGGLPEAVARNAELTEFLLPLLRSDFQLWRQYGHQPRKPMLCPITALRGVDDDIADAPAVRAWQEHTSADFAFLEVEGGHYFANDMPADTARLIADRLARG
ncbi:thioesterase II family protein [Actinocorallia longicatena]|uniref:Thioesterase domain-containing protein n=1 Tax=Actinocorallia longicatena TaxID=111803 RepID=A0ABP6QD78_9ACTN